MRLILLSALFQFSFFLSAQQGNQALLQQKLIELDFTQQELKHIVIQSEYLDEQTGIWHAYLQYQFNNRCLLPDMLSFHYSRDNISYTSGSLPKNIIASVSKLSFKIQVESIIFNHLQKDGVNSAFSFLPSLRGNESGSFLEITIDEFPEDQYQFREIYFNNENAIFPAYEIFWKHVATGDWIRSIWNAETGAILLEQSVYHSCDFKNINFYRPSLFSIESITTSAVDCYHVFGLPVESPSHGSRSMQFAPWNKATNASSLGWHHDGANTYTVSKGNNVDAYEDSDNDNQPTGGNAARANGGSNRNFDFPLNHALPPLSNKNAAITNLFYWCNIMHDVWYQYGFTEQAGNFQNFNFGNGGMGNDYVMAEAIDNLGYARNNANFGTGPDGVSGHMQMYVWKLPIQDIMVVNNPPQLGSMIYVAGAIGERVLFPLTSSLVLAEDASNFPNCGCNNYTNGSTVKGNIALVDRGICGFTTKITRAQNAGAIGILVCNTEPYDPYVIGGISNNITIPVMMISKVDCERIKENLHQGINVTFMPSSTLNFSFQGKKLIFSRASYGSTIPNGTGNIVLAQDGIGDVNDACQVIINGPELSGKIALINDKGCDVTYKIYQAQQQGAATAILCKMESGLPDRIEDGAYAQSITIPVIKLSKQDCDLIKLNLPAQGTYSNTTPQLTDGDFDAGIICHEYGHGISNRLTGGPNNTSCLSNAEQMGEGWSDYFGLAMTMRPSDNANTVRGVGTYNSGQSNNGVGVRPYPYSINLLINPANYGMLEDQILISQPHGIGFVWCSMLWDLHWAMVARYGLDPDWYNLSSGKGNIKAAQLIMEGMKLQACSPGFVDGRNAILQADAMLFGGSNSCLIWNIFARRGLGYSAQQGSTNNRSDGVPAYDLPSNCIRMSDAQLFNTASLADFQLAVTPVMSNENQMNLFFHWDLHIPINRLWWERKINNQIDKQLDIDAQIINEGNTTAIDQISRGTTTVYYRLNAQSISGKLYKSSWAKLKLNDDRNNKWKLIQNPANDQLNIIAADDRYEGEVSLMIFNTQMQVLDRQDLYMKKGDKIQCAVRDLPGAMYYILISINGSSELIKFVKS